MSHLAVWQLQRTAIRLSPSVEAATAVMDTLQGKQNSTLLKKTDADAKRLQWRRVLSAEVVRPCELLVGRRLRDVRVDHFSYPTRMRSR